MPPYGGNSSEGVTCFKQQIISFINPLNAELSGH